MIDAKRGVAVGGDYKDPERAENHFAITEDGGQTWKLPDQDQFLSMGWDIAPFGYRSCVTSSNLTDGKTALLAVGPAGTDLSLDHGNSWVSISKQGFHAAQFSPSGTVGWGVGSDGRVSKWHSNK
jgi:Neuraminidase (sialidase)